MMRRGDYAVFLLYGRILGLGVRQKWCGAARKQESRQAEREVKRIVVTLAAGRDGFWLARWLRARGIEAHVIHPTIVSVPREQRRAKNDRPDTQLLKRAAPG